MVKNICTPSRGRFCYVSFVVSLIFFISSVLVFAVMAATKTNEKAQNIPNVIEEEAECPNTQQKRIIKRLKDIEKRIVKRKNK